MAPSLDGAKICCFSDLLAWYHGSENTGKIATRRATMTVADKAFSLLEHVTAEDVRALPPAARRNFAARCRHLATIADPPGNGAQRQAGVLGELHSGQRGD
jgi:hypothetical protein